MVYIAILFRLFCTCLIFGASKSGAEAIILWNVIFYFEMIPTSEVEKSVTNWVEAVGLSVSNYTYKMTIVLSMWNLG